MGGGPAQAVGLAAAEGVLCLLLAEGGGRLGTKITTVAVAVAVALDVNVDVDVILVDG